MARCARKLVPLILVAALLGLLKLSVSGHLLVNVTGSIPLGIYWISPLQQPMRGQLVTLPIPEESRSLLYERKYVPQAIKLLAKPVAAVRGDHVCVRDGRLIINGALAGKVRDKDFQGRAMPRHIICRLLERDEVFLATAHDNSFDSRNFGPVKLKSLRGTLIPILTR